MDIQVRKGSPLNPTDRLAITFWSLLSLVSVFLHSRLEYWWAIPLANLAAVVLIHWIARGSQSASGRVLRCLHDWAPYPIAIFTYKQIYFLIRLIHQGKDYDQLLIALDRMVFRINPTEWLAQFSNPFLTEVLQIAYSLFYAIFLIIGLELYRKRDLSRFYYFGFAMVYGFFLSYLGYLSLPSAGPRFTLHDFSKMDVELPGLLVTPALRWFINISESICPGMSNAVALAAAQRDVFPSGHTMLTVVAVALAFRYRLKVRNWMLVLGILLIVATVYLRYHYVVDLLAGALLALVCLATADKAYALFQGKHEQVSSG